MVVSVNRYPTNAEEIIKSIEAEYLKHDLPKINVGDTVKVGVRIAEGGKERVQPYQGVVIAMRNGGISETITVRRVFQGVGVERVFLLHSPLVASIQVISRGKVRRAKLYYLRDRVGKATRIKQRFDRPLDDSPKPSNQEHSQLDLKKDEKISTSLIYSEKGFMNKIDPKLTIDFGISNENDLTNIPEHSKKKKLDMLIRLSKPEWDTSKIPDYKEIFRLGRSVGCVGTIRTVKALQEDPNIVFVQASRRGYQEIGATPTYPSHSSSTSERPSICELVNAHIIHNEIGEKGDKALIAIVDTGIDILHKAFRDSTGEETRILAIWDQTVEGQWQNPTPVCTFGREYTHEDILRFINNANTVPDSLRDNRGHGTGVTSVAAGRQCEGFSGGIAPEAKIIVVIIDSLHGLDNDLGSALTYINYYSERVVPKLPVVINISQGKNIGPHDGTDNLEFLIDDKYGILEAGEKPGVIIVKSAGNDRRTQRHQMVSLFKDIEVELKWYQETGKTEQELEVWFDSSNRLQFVLKNPTGQETTPPFAWNSLIRQKHTTFLTNDNCTMEYIRDHERNGNSQLQIKIERKDGEYIQSGSWILKIIKRDSTNKDDKAHAWLDVLGTERTTFFTRANEFVTLSTPGTAHNILVVSSHEDTSSKGRTREGREKPEISIPSVEIEVAQSGTLSSSVGRNGTSYFAPFLTGAIALLLSQLNKSESSNLYNSRQMKSLVIRATSQQNGHFNEAYGFGSLNVYNLFMEAGLIERRLD